MAKIKKSDDKDMKKTAKIPSDNKADAKSRRRPDSRKRSRRPRDQKAQQFKVDLSAWKPKTALGREVKDREITDIDEILDVSRKILESEIVDSLLTLEQDLLLIGQSKGKFGGGSRRVFRQTQKKTREGNKPKFSTLAVVGDKNGHVGLGFGKAKETVPAREKAIRKAKLNIFKLRRGCGSWQCGCGTPHSIPFSVYGKCGSVIIHIMPAPKGKGLCCEKEIAKILDLAGINDVWTKTRGQTKNKINFISACEDALRKLIRTKVQPEHRNTLAIVEGCLPKAPGQEQEEEEIGVKQGQGPEQEQKQEQGKDVKQEQSQSKNKEKIKEKQGNKGKAENDT